MLYMMKNIDEDKDIVKMKNVNEQEPINVAINDQTFFISSSKNILHYLIIFSRGWKDL